MKPILLMISPIMGQTIVGTTGGLVVKVGLDKPKYPIRIFYKITVLSTDPFKIYFLVNHVKQFE